MSSARSSLVALPSVAALVLTLGACSSGGADSPPPFSEGALSADPELRELEVGADELVADEATSDAELEKLAWPAASEPQEEGSSPDDLLDQSPFDPSLPDELPEPPPDLGQETGPAFSSLSLQDAPIGTARVWWSQSFDCPRNPLKASCVCRGSMYNCQFPNPQPGRNRYLPPAAIRALRAVTGPKSRVEIIEKVGKWGIENSTAIYDGSGHARGTVLGSCYSFANGVVQKDDRGHPCVKVNFGQLKRMQVDGSSETKAYVYAFDVTISPPPAPGKSGGSGWILAANIKESAFKRYDTPPRFGGGATFARTEYVLKAATDYSCTLANYDSDRCLPAWAQLKIRPRSPATVSEKARDYMLRDGNVVNLAYQTPLVGGAATDTFVVQPNALAFERVRSLDSSRRTLLRISLFDTNGTVPRNTMLFVFGRVAGRHGWVAASAIKKGRASKVDSTCIGKRDTRFCNADASGSVECRGQELFATQACPTGQKCQSISADNTMVCR